MSDLCLFVLHNPLPRPPSGHRPSLHLSQSPVARQEGGIGMEPEAGGGSWFTLSTCPPPAPQSPDITADIITILNHRQSVGTNFLPQSMSTFLLLSNTFQSPSPTPFLSHDSLLHSLLASSLSTTVCYGGEGWAFLLFKLTYHAPLPQKMQVEQCISLTHTNTHTMCGSEIVSDRTPTHCSSRYRARTQWVT